MRGTMVHTEVQQREGGKLTDDVDEKLIAGTASFREQSTFAGVTRAESDTWSKISVVT
jgi:hypothetical protein